MAINERLIDTAVAASGDTGTGNQEEGLILHLDANDVDSYDGDGTEWVDIKDHEYTPATNVSEHFNTVTYEGDGNADRDITGLGFTPDFVWIKNRSTSDSHQLYDSLRGNYGLYSNGTDAQFLITDWEIINDGFDLGAANSGRNGNGNDIVAWCWKAGGAPSGSDTVSIDGTSYADEAAAGLTAGTIAVSGLSVNTDLGFSIAKVVDHTGTPTISHGLGTAPELIITKVLDSSSYNWYVYHKDLGNTKFLNLNTTAAAGTDNFWDNTSPTSQVFTHRFSNIAFDMIYYCFASKRGVSKVGSYTGTGAVGNKVYTGFEPAFVMVKRTNGTGDWMMHDNKRSANNGDGQDLVLYANLNNSEDEYSSGGLTFDTDGFTINVTPTSTNLSGGEYIYYAVAKDTNETSLIPDTDLELHLDADSFPEKGEAGYSNTPTTWTALTGSNGTITGATFDSELGNWLDFDGSNDFVATNHTQGTSTSFTFESWININNTTGRKSIIGDINSTGVDTSTRFFLEVSGGGDKLKTTIGNGVTSSTHTSTTSLSANTWHHVSATISGTSVKFYVDGTHTDSFTLSFSFGTAGAQTYTIGAAGDLRTTILMDGQIGQVRMYDAALTEAQIRQNYNFTKPSYPNGYNFTGDNMGSSDWNSDGYFSFNGSDENFSATSFTPALTDVQTVSYWVNNATISGNETVFSIGQTGNSNAYSWISFGYDATAGAVKASYGDSTGDLKNGTITNSAYIGNTWHHVCFLVFPENRGTSSQCFKVYIDGVEVAVSNSTTSTALPTVQGYPFIGKYSRDYQDLSQFSGDLAKLRVYDRRLTEAEITALHCIGR